MQDGDGAHAGLGPLSSGVRPASAGWRAGRRARSLSAVALGPVRPRPARHGEFQRQMNQEEMPLSAAFLETATDVTKTDSFAVLSSLFGLFLCGNSERR